MNAINCEGDSKLQKPYGKFQKFSAIYLVNFRPRISKVPMFFPGMFMRLNMDVPTSGKLMIFRNFVIWSKWCWLLTLCWQLYCALKSILVPVYSHCHISFFFFDLALNSKCLNKLYLTSRRRHLLTSMMCYLLGNNLNLLSNSFRSMWFFANNLKGNDELRIKGQLVRLKLPCYSTLRIPWIL